MSIPLKSQKEIEAIAVAGRILAKILKAVSREAKAGTKLSQLNKLAYQLTKKEGAEPAFLGYKPNGASKPFGASICASVNEVVVHGFPSDYKLQSGDVLKIDFGVEYKKFFADAAVTLGIGAISQEAKRLIKITRLALKKAVNQAKPGNHLEDLGWIIQKTSQSNGLKVIKSLTGHGVGLELHEDPTIYNFGRKGGGIELKPGMVLAIEPMFAISTEKIIQRPDESWATADDSLSAHFEHTVAITERGCKILTIDN
ncbi:type I methionyl aminopeptidase [Candidatus Wolfebacteria bacterium CG1_02_39_135]|uniref:Methionine aminopeptidase n=2 Tax=Candidatus Wolfeibacteriota TaxID=1752735 RepID=A0A2M7B711_9BACT|nr:type I methionyl aminopeptidase [Candidatus Wolfebacteria bacterium]NCQ02457.1 type I methionyl aminopeptidase [Candidatus Wolfebacteria bacterium]OIO65493.1 MAG: type I methionyl aminopeptidase [Candidatus Wolfebacteria bacterium CG1_02_39_135]PIU98887.1 MAG: type I methionyl aminopeptidase [Candidatus Wolfebacteria bacterium CG03_land_8_20_14_0_80_39_317]